MISIEEDDYVEYKDRSLLKTDDLSKEQRAFLDDLNKKLMTIEETIYNECESLSRKADERIADPDDWVRDYELKCVLCFYLKEDAPEYNDDVDNILIELQENCKDFYKNHVFGIMDGINHKTCSYPEETEEEKFHCWLFHYLYDHTELGWINILRIGMIWVDIDIKYKQRRL
jgi:hypothetical protein